jgi:hypothetical protein
MPYGPFGLGPSVCLVFALVIVIRTQHAFQKSAIKLKDYTYKGDIVPIASPSFKISRRESRRGSIPIPVINWPKSHYRF